jgi:hypothetical protein
MKSILFRSIYDSVILYLLVVVCILLTDANAMPGWGYTVIGIIAFIISFLKHLEKE